MGRFVFEDICTQWLRRHAQERLGLTVRDLGRYWSRDGRLEIDVAGELETGAFLFGECKWRADSVVRLGDYSSLKTKVMALPEARWRNRPTFILFAVGGFASELQQLAADPDERLFLVSCRDLLPR